MRKKTYLEQLQDRVNGNSDTSVYTDKEKTKVSNSSVRNQVDNLYNRNKTNIQQDDIWERVKARANDILNSTSKITNIAFSNFGNKANTYNELDTTRLNQKNKNESSILDRKTTILNVYDNLYKNQKPQLHSNQENNYSAKDNPVIDKKIMLPQKKESQLTTEQLEELSKLNSRERFKKINSLPINEKAKKQLQKQSYIYNSKKYSKEEAEKINKKVENGNVVEKAEGLTKNILRGFITGAATGFGDIFTTAYNATTLAGNALGVETLQQKKKGMVDGKELVNDYKKMKEIESEYASNLNGIINSGTYRLSQVAGNMFPAATTGSMFEFSNLPKKTIEGIRKITSALSSGSSAYLDTLDEEQTNGVKSALKSALYGFATYKIEGITGGNFISKQGSLDDIAVKEISKFKNEFSKKIASSIYEATGESIEENVENIADHLIDFAFGDAKDISLKSLIEEAGQTTADTMALNFIMQALGLGGATYNDVKLNDISQKIDNSNLNKSQKEAIKEVMQEENNPMEGEYLLKNRIAENQQTRIENEKVLNNNQQVNREQDKNSQNQFSSKIEENKQNQVNIVDENQRKLEKVLQKDKYKENQNASNFFKSANENNLDINNEKIESLFDLPNARGIKTEFNQEMFKDQNGNIKENINAIYVTDSEGNRNIIYNPKANQENIVEKNVIHETFHDMAGTKEVQEITDFVYNKIKDTTDFQDAFNSLKEVYSQVTDNESRILYNSESVEFENMIKEEAVADYLGQNLGTQEYINELVNGKESRNIAQKIYDAIVKFLDKVTGYKSEEAYLRGLKDKFEKAFNSKYANSNEQTKYSIAGKKAMENAINKDSQYKIIEESYNKALKMAKENVDNEQIRQKTNWFQDKNGDWKFEFSDKDMSLKNIYFKEDKVYKLKDILEHETLFLLYPELKEQSVIFSTIKSNGQFNKKENTIMINSKKLKSKNVIEGTLLHELQHAIQNIENFEGGLTSKFSKLAYYNKLGEIEANDTKQRFLKEQEGNLNRDKVAPESSKNNPKHQNLNNYLKKRNIVEKVKDGVYNYIKNFVEKEKNSYEEYIEENRKNNNDSDSQNVFQINGNSNRQMGNRLIREKVENNNKGLENSSSFSLQENKGKWQEFLEKNTINKEGTRTTLRELKKLPQKKEIKLPKKQNKSIVSNINDNKPTRHDVIQENRKIAKENIKNIATWKDKKSGLKYQLETMERNIYDIIPDKQEAKKVIETYFEPVHVKEAEKQKFINKYNNRIQELKLNKYESEATQFLGELKYNPNFKMTPELKRILDKINNNIQNGKINKEKIDNAIETFRNIYDELFDIENNELRRNGYQEKTYRRGYFPHFIDYVPETRTEKVLNKLGFKIDKRALPTDISGITEQFVPGKTWNQSSLERKTNKTDFNALKGFDTYIAQASDNIFHTENIQKLRALENEIRYQYSEKGIQAEIDSILNNETLNQEEKQALIDQKFEQIANPMPNLVVELRRYTNALANKKSEADRSTEQTAGRQFYSIVNAIENRFAGNAVGLNMGSALTNFIPITQAYSQVSSINMGRAMLDTMKSYMKDDGFIDKSTFLTNRLNKSEKLYKTALEKISEKANIPFDAVDSITSNIVVRGKYLENIKNGMSETEAIKNADSFAASLMADRSKGSLPTKFEEKNPLTKAFTQFQLEVNNQYRYILKDIPRDLKDKGLGNLALAYFKMFITAWLYNKISKEMTGRDQAFSPIDLIKSSYDTIMNDDLNTYNKITNIATEFGEQAPFIGGLLGGGRIPVNGALPDIANITKAGVGLATGEMDTKKAFKSLGKEIAKPGYYLLPPFGGGQLKKTVEGIKTVKEGGSYGIDNKGQKTLQFPVENKSAGDYIKAGVFGKYSLPKAKSYVDNKFKSFNAKQTQLYDNSDIEYDTLKEYFDYSSQKGIKQKDKIEHINTMKISTDDKWNLYKYNILSSNKRKDGTSQVTDAEYAIKNKLATKSNYMKLYENAIKNNIDFPDTDSLKELKENGLSLNTYIDYNINYKNASEEKKNLYKNKLPVSKETMSLKLNEKVELMKNYTVEEKRIIYSNYINKEDEIYKTISKLEYGETNIDEYLDYKIQNFESDENTKSNIAGKKVSKGEGTSKNKTLNYINNSNMTDLEKAYIVETTYKGVLNSKTLEELTNIVKNKITDKKELEEVLDKFKDLEKHKDDGNYYKK